MKVALYARVSTDDGRQDTENQLHELRQFAERNGWEIAGEYVDNATGKHSDRPQFKLMFEHAEQKQFNLVLFWALDRLSREGVLETLTHLRKLNDCGVDWQSFTEQFFNSCGPFKDAVISIMASLARLEREKISERTKAGMRRAKRAGTHLGRKATELPGVSEIRQMQSDGLTLAAIAEKHNVSTRTIMRRIS